MTTIFFKFDAHPFSNRIEYVINFIQNHPLVRDRIRISASADGAYDLTIGYGVESDDGFYIPAQEIYFSEALQSKAPRFSNGYHFGKMELYAIEAAKKEPQEFILNNFFQFDVLETIFFHISRVEECFCLVEELDKHERMDTKKQFLIQQQLHCIPVVDHLVLAFVRALGIKVEDQPVRNRMTHDIDEVIKRNGFLGKMRTTAAALLKRRDLHRAKRVLQDDTQNPYDVFDWLLLEENRFEKVIYFLVDGDSKFDSPYDLDDPIVQKAIQLAKVRGYDVGIHPSYNTLRNQEKIETETQKLKAKVEENITMTRQHYLRFDLRRTPKILDQIGFTEDSSLGFADRIGFRCGTGFPYHLYDFENEKPYRFLECPLVFMESALLHESNFNAERFKKIWTEFLAANQMNTMITFNFHNSRFYDAALSGIDMEGMYRQCFISDDSPE